MPTPASSSRGLYAGAPARGFGDAISTCLSKYFTFSGRASRSEYWYFVLFNFLVGLAAAIVDMAFFGVENDLSPINSLVVLVLFLPSLAAGVRRLHDSNRSGWWYGSFYLWIFGGSISIGIIAAANPSSSGDFMGFAFAVLGIGFLVNLIALLVFFCWRGDPSSNRFG